MSEWKTTELGNVITLKRGYDLPQQKRKSGLIPIFSSSGVSGSHNTAMVKAPGVITGRYGTIGQVFYADTDFWPLNTTLYVEDFHGNDPQFVYYFLKTLEWEKFTSASAVPGINRNTVHKEMVTIPDIVTQRAIAEYLALIDKKIVVNYEINDNLQQQAYAYFLQLFVENVDPSWRVGTIADLGAVVGGGTPSKAKPEYYTEDGIAWITPKDLSVDKSKFIAHGENDISELGYRNSSATMMPAGTVLFSSRAPIGYIAIASNEVTTNQGFKSVVPRPEIGTPFVYYFLLHNLPLIESKASGSTFKEVSGSVMKSVEAVIPDSDTIAKLNDFCCPIFEMQAKLEQENRTLVAMRDSLLPRLMSGEIDVSDIDV